MKIKSLLLVFLILLGFHKAVIAGEGYAGLICNGSKNNDVSVLRLMSDNYNGYSYLQFKTKDNKLFGAYVYYGGAQYHAYVQETMRIAMMAYIFKLKVNVCYKEGIINDSINAIELAS